jgi:hypothetical protein
MARKESAEFTLFGDLEGITVARLREMLDEYSGDAVIDVRTEKVYGYGGWTDEDREFFVFTWEE